MRWIIEYFKSLFCTHSWELIFNTQVNYSDGTVNHVKTYRCKKCGCSKSYRSS